MNPVDRFASEASDFAQWAESGTDSGGLAARNGLLKMTRLYISAMELPYSLGEKEDDESEGERVDAEQWRHVFDHAARLPVDYYGAVFDPLTVPPEEPVLGSLADDIADTYRDVITGLRYFNSGKREKALWEWAFSFQVHTGQHLTAAIRVLHCWLASNEPWRLSGE